RDPVTGAGVCAGERPAARFAVGDGAAGSCSFDRERSLPVLELAHVVVALLAIEAGGRVVPAEEDVAGGLHQPLAGDDTLAAIAVFAFAGELLEHRALGFLDLQEQRILVVATEEERDPGACADATHAYHLAGQI